MWQGAYWTLLSQWPHLSASQSVSQSAYFTPQPRLVWRLSADITGAQGEQHGKNVLPSRRTGASSPLSSHLPSSLGFPPFEVHVGTRGCFHGSPDFTSALNSQAVYRITFIFLTFVKSLFINHSFEIFPCFLWHLTAKNTWGQRI